MPYVTVLTGTTLKFEWDPRKAAVNTSKHRVSFAEAVTVFGDPLARIFDDEDHSSKEHREIIIGHSSKARLLVVCFSSREDNVRIISARRATKTERKDYEESVQP